MIKTHMMLSSKSGIGKKMAEKTALCPLLNHQQTQWQKEHFQEEYRQQEPSGKSHLKEAVTS